MDGYFFIRLLLILVSHFEIVNHISGTVLIKWALSVQELKGHHSEGPVIALGSVNMGLGENFRSEILLCATIDANKKRKEKNRPMQKRRY